MVVPVTVLYVFPLQYLRVWIYRLKLSKQSPAFRIVRRNVRGQDTRRLFPG